MLPKVPLRTREAGLCSEEGGGVSALTSQQIGQLLKPIAPQRVLRDGKGHSHVSQQDVRAHLIRIFGFGGFDTQILELALVSERERRSDSNVVTGWDVVYRCQIRLIVKAEDGTVIASYDDAATGQGSNQKTLADAHDLACKSAVSYALKRAATNLGDQYGLSLYNKGQTSALVLATLVGTGDHDGDMQSSVPQQVSLGNVEGGDDPHDAEPLAAEPAPVAEEDLSAGEVRRLIGMWVKEHDVAIPAVEEVFAGMWPGNSIRTASAKVLLGFLAQLRNGEVLVGEPV